MIIRVFRPTVHPGKEREFEAFLRDTAAPLVSRQSGLLAQHVGRPRDPSSTEYVYVTVWEDVESIRAFAGERWENAVTTPTRSTCSRTPGLGITRSSRHLIDMTPGGRTTRAVSRRDRTRSARSVRRSRRETVPGQERRYSCTAQVLPSGSAKKR
jgi:heme-degrading monooxygenase HmoA